MTIIISGAVILALAISYLIYSLAFSQKFFMGVRVANVSLSGLTKSEAKLLLNDKITNVKAEDLDLTFNQEHWKITSDQLNVNYNLDSTINYAFMLGRDGNPWTNFRSRIALIFKSRKMPVSFSYNRAEIGKIVDQISLKTDVVGNDARLEVKDGKVNIINEKPGKAINKDKLFDDFIYNVGNLVRPRNLAILEEDYQPKITSAELASSKSEIERIIQEPIVLKWEKENFTIDSKISGSWLEIATGQKTDKIARKYVPAAQASEGNYALNYLFNEEKIKMYVESISQGVNKDPVDAKLSITGGKASVFQSSQDGYELDQDKAVSDIGAILNKRGKIAGVSSDNNNSLSADEIALLVKTKKATITNDTINNLGIKELIGKGTTDFRNSPPNRITNIKVGTNLFNGYLIKPGETFSTLAVLGAVSTAQGFLPELVIKEDRTEPEVGGGLCQVSTTLFRAALNSGLPIVERTNHKYRVSYYEPPVGMDATIYQPSPDLKFKNDTPGYILIQSYVTGTKVNFEFYGTNDGRKVEISDPVVYDVTTPPEPRYIDDPSLAPGEVKKVESAHNGAKASFHYKVTRGNEVTFEETFNSTYVPWQAVFKKGPDLPAEPAPAPAPAPTPAPEPAPTPTPEPTPTPTP